MSVESGKREIRFDEITLLILDVDGVLTDGGLIYNGDGTESKIFSALDGHGIRMWIRGGGLAAFLSGRESAVTGDRAKSLGVEIVYQNCHNKLEAFEEITSKTGVAASGIGYIGDDLMDIPVMRRVGFSAAVNNAVDEVKEIADYRCEKKGGSGAVREVIEYLLKKGGRWDSLCERYYI
jgi:3-deoxy-D-manno-octulosonate 8-phosphate phosphatase (KDO 8-P phosphatase)